MTVFHAVGHIAVVVVLVIAISVFVTATMTVPGTSLAEVAAAPFVVLVAATVVATSTAGSTTAQPCGRGIRNIDDVSVELGDELMLKKPNQYVEEV